MWSGISSLYGRRRERRVDHLVLALGLVVAFGCAGRSTFTADDDDTSGGRGGKGGAAGRGGTTGRAGHGGSAGQAAGHGGSAGTGGTDVPYMDPGCPDAAPPDPVVECSVFATPSGCPDGFACKPSIEHPYGSGCDQQVFNMYCLTPGSGTQGASCDDGFSDCAAGYICVVGAASGARCLSMCPLDGGARCPSGFVCSPTDVEGVGVCT